MPYIEESLDLPLAQVLSVIQTRIIRESTYFGIKALKSPLDYWVYQEMIVELKPDVIIEIGNKSGGSTLAFAHLCDLLGKGRVIGVDLTHGAIPGEVKAHPRITLIEGDACDSFDIIQGLIGTDERVLVIEDSSHSYENTLNILNKYSSLVKLGDYVIVEDSICHHGLATGPKPGPYEAIESFTKMNAAFESDRARESFLVTWNPKGYLKRIAGDRATRDRPVSKPGRIKRYASSAVGLLLPPVIVLVCRKVWGAFARR